MITLQKHRLPKDLMSYFSTIEMYFPQPINEKKNGILKIMDPTSTKTYYGLFFLHIFLEMRGKNQAHHRFLS